MDTQYHLRRQESNIAKASAQMNGESRLHELRDDPLAASHAVRYDSFLKRLDRFEKNNRYANDYYNVAQDYMNEAITILHKVRELSVEHANGVYTPEDLKLAGIEVNELLKELVALSNKVGPDGKPMFAGDKAFTEPFRIVEGITAGGTEIMVTNVEYRGAGATRRTEISDNAFIDLDLGGGEVFWAEKMQIFSNVNGSNYRVNENGSMFIDGVEIKVNTGDTLPAIVAKINDSGAPVKAYIDPDTRGLVLEGTNPHLIRAEDGFEGATVLKDLGIIRGNMENNAPNWDNVRSRVSGGSMFDMMIRVRDAMFRGDYDFIGSQGIGGMDLAMNNMTTRLAQVGSRQERAEIVWERLNREITNVQANLSRESGIDLTTAVTDLKMLELAHRATLQTSARILPVSLLDFLR
jgi:flagellar hook-associated protein 3 FlgL